MTASSPVTMADLVNGLKFNDSEGDDWTIMQASSRYELTNGVDGMNYVELSSDGLTITFGNNVSQGPQFTGFTWNA